MMNGPIYGSQNAAYVLDPLSLEVNQQYEITLPPTTTLQTYLANFNEDFEMADEPNFATQILYEANIQFKPHENQLDYILEEPSEKVIVIQNKQDKICPFMCKDFNLHESSVMLSPKSMSPVSCTSEDDFEEIQVCFEQADKNAPKISVKEVIEKTRKYVSKKKKNGVTKRGRPAAETDDDILSKIESLKKGTDKKATRIAKNTEASRRYRRKLTIKRNQIDNFLEEELKKFEKLTEHHRTLQQEINRLKLALNVKRQ